MQNSTLTGPIKTETAPGSAVMRAARPACFEALGAGFSGLVISAISREGDFLERLLEKTFAFPSAEMVDAAASLFPIAATGMVGAWHGLVGTGVGSKVVDGKKVQRIAAGYGEHRTWGEGARARIEVAPGLVRVARVDRSKAERVRERVEETRKQRVDYETQLLMRPMALADTSGVGRGTRAAIAAWSAKSRARLISTICELDLSELVGGDMLPCMVTLTLPGDWLAVVPTAARGARIFDNFRKAFEDRWQVPMSNIWKREFQKRGAPHWHLWMVPPVPMHKMAEFREWLSAAWTAALFGAAAAGVAVAHAVDGVCDCSEECKSLSAGTGVDFAEGLRARDPKRLAVYFLKESLGGEDKAYQNAPPREWEGQPVGRFWGYRGLQKSVAAVPLDPGVDVAVVRAMRRWQASQGITVMERTLDGRVTVKRVRVTREVTVQGTRERNARARRRNRATGEVTTRKLRRPQPLIGAAGWIACNSGSGLASKLAKVATVVAAERAASRDMFADWNIRGDSVTVERPSWAAEGPVDSSGRWPVVAVIGTEKKPSGILNGFFSSGGIDHILAVARDEGRGRFRATGAYAR